MKKFLILLICIGITSISEIHASDYSGTETLIKKQCNLLENSDYFFKGSYCKGEESSIYYIKDAKVTKDVFDAQKKEYDTNGPLCEETKESRTGELPSGLTASCKKGEYGSYFNKGIKIPYAEFQEILLQEAWINIAKETKKKEDAYLKKQKQLLKSLRSFIKDLRSKDPVFSYTIVGSKCTGNGTFLFNGDGYKDMICVNGRVKSMKYILKNQEVSFSVYISSVYNKEKNALK